MHEEKRPMPKQRTPVSPAETTPPGPNGGGVAARDRLSMQEAADFLMEDVDAVADLLVHAGVPLVRESGATYVSRRDLADYRERDRAARREGVREITRRSIAAGLDDLDYAPLYEDRP
jgi:hypothetical protein